MLSGYLYGDHTDVAIVMASYLRWGVDFASQIIGDFALSLWDPSSRTLMLARDPVGARLLYYHSDGRRIIWSTDLGSLLDLAGIELQINEDYIANFLTRYPESDQTPYKNMHPVPPAHIVVASPRQVQTRRVWGLDPSREIRYKTDTEYEEHFRQLFRDAVRCRLRSDTPVWAELSGGLDSSTIVCMADDIMKRGEADAPGLVTVSRVYDEASLSDERMYILPVEERIGRKALHLREDDYRMVTPLSEKYSRVIPNPIADAAEYFSALSGRMRERGARVLLSGQGGDEILISAKDPSPELAELLLRGRLLQLHRRVKAWCKVSKSKSYFRILWRYGITPALPSKLAAHNNASLVTLSKLYRQEFVQSMDFRRRLCGPRDVFGFRYPVGREQSRTFLIFVRALSAGYFQGLIDADTTYPYTHRPLIEFAHAIPIDQKVRPSETRSIVRRALQDLLPPEVAGRRDKGLFIHAYLRGLAREWQRLNELFTDARVCAYAYVKPEALRDLVNLAKQGDEQRSSFLMFLICLEYWLRALETRRSAARITHPLLI